MAQSVKATFKDGVLEPSESLDLEDGQQARIIDFGNGRCSSMR